MYIKSHENKKAIDKWGDMFAANLTDTGPLTYMWKEDLWFKKILNVTTEKQGTNMNNWETMDNKHMTNE